MMETRAEPSIYCCDLWPLDKLTVTKQQAYKALEAQKEIKILKITVSRKQNRVHIEYLSASPHDWTLNMLKNITAQIESSMRTN